ncbi:MAG TPA: HIT family protein [Vicinamibacteria bacterium]|nr:HIT family protein [Vicinamibacteria bacterium]
MRQPDCVFCERVRAGSLVAETLLAAAFPDAFPLNPGHILIVSRRHEPDFFSLTTEERRAIWELVESVRVHIEAHYAPQGYNLGINVGSAAGQTVGHAHLHVIPRYDGDVGDPRGGIRWLLPARARYWGDL